MVTVNIDPVLVHLGPIAVSWYGPAIAAAIFVAFHLTVSEARRRGIDTDPLADLVIWVVIGGLVGGRLLHVIDRLSSYVADPMQVLMIQNGGLAIEGAILGGTLAGIIGARRLGLPVFRLSDAVAQGLILGQAIGRLGCLVNGDALGPATGGTWAFAMSIQAHSVVPPEQTPPGRAVVRLVFGPVRGWQVCIDIRAY
jgi:phosphatidylglycerol---prolipoprotein diacylglyceryl transferase